MKNVDPKTVEGFGEEWSRFDQNLLGVTEAQELFDAYFAVFPWAELPSGARGFDMGCGSGRWARVVATRVGQLHCVDASGEALAVARSNLAALPNCEFHQQSVDALPFADASMDFGYSLGVLHHVPNTQLALAQCVRALKRGAPFLVYLYYRFDNRPAWFRRVWEASDRLRRVVSRLPVERRHLITDAVAMAVYWPLARGAALLERAGLDVSDMPLAAYRRRSFYTMRTDALDRFGTRLEQRFTRAEIRGMMERAGLERIEFSETEPFWCAVGRRSG